MVLPHRSIPRDSVSSWIWPRASDFSLAAYYLVTADKMALPLIRYHIELFSARMLHLFPSSCWPFVVERLNDMNNKPQVLPYGLLPYTFSSVFVDTPLIRSRASRLSINDDSALFHTIRAMQILTSYLIAVGLACFGKDTPPIPSPLQVRLVNSILPWLGSTHSFARVISQLVCYDLIPLVLPEKRDEGDPTMHQEYLW